jgi:heme/copper-type cytochrome/quinol oxidase subunit 2
MTVLDQLSSGTMYLICGAIVAFVAVVCVIFLVRAWRAGKAMGMDTARMKQAVTASVTFSILPSVGILLGVIALSGSLGIPWPWLRLSVIGALHYETQVAQAAAEQLGSTLSGDTMTADAFSTIALLMSVCIMWGMILAAIFNPRYTRKLQGKGNGSGKPGFGDRAMVAMFIGMVSAYIGSYIGDYVSGAGKLAFAGSWTPLAVVAAAALTMAVFTYFSEKKGKEWLDNFSIAGSMLVGMLAAVLIGR